jgi:peptide/nickel transport system substrate-binding protein
MARFRVALGLLAAGGLLLAGCGGTGTPTTTGGAAKPAATSSQPGPAQTIVVATTISDAATLDPSAGGNLSAVEVDRLLYDTLVRFPSGDLTKTVPSLASSWSVSANGQQWTFHLRSGVVFSSGDPVTAQDVVYSFERVVNLPVAPGSYLITGLGITKANVDQVVQAPNATMVTINLPKPFSPSSFLATLANPIASVVDSKVVKAHITNGDWGAAWMADHSAGSGPYTLVDWTHDVVLLNVADNTTQLDMLNRGQADMAADLTNSQIQSLQSSGSVSVLKVPDIGIVYIGMDGANEPAFADPRVREAVKYAIDYKGIVQNLLDGNGIAEQGLIPSGLFGYDSSLPFTQNLAKAKQLMAQAGQAKGFSVTMLISDTPAAGGVPSKDIGETVASDLAKIGITVNLRQLARSELISEFQHRQTQMVLNDWFMDYPDPGDFIGPLADGTEKAVAWRINYSNPQVSKLVQQADTLQNTPQRLALLKQINTLMQAGPYAVLYQPDVVLAYSNKLQNVKYDASNFIDFPQITKK